MKGHQMLAKLRKDQENEEGFTLIELLVVVIIIGILAAIAIPAFLNQRERAYQAAIVSDVRNAALDIEAIGTSANGIYPTGADLVDNTKHDYDTEIEVTEPAATTITYRQGTVAGKAGAAFCLFGTRTDINAGSAGALYVTTEAGMQDFNATAAPTCPTANGETWGTAQTLAAPPAPPAP